MTRACFRAAPAPPRRSDICNGVEFSAGAIGNLCSDVMRKAFATEAQLSTTKTDTIALVTTI